MVVYEYETSPRKIKPEYETTRKKTSKNIKSKKVYSSKNNSKIKTASKVKTVLFVLIGFTLFFAISYRNAIIDKKYADIRALKTELADIEKENEQLEATIESKLNLKNIQAEAENKLGMKVLSNDQIEYVSIPKVDYVEASSEEVKIEDDENIFEKVWNNLKELVK